MGFRVIQCIKDQSIVTDAGLAQPAGEAPVQDWLASFAAQQNLQRLADTLGQRPLTPIGDVGVAGGFALSLSVVFYPTRLAVVNYIPTRRQVWQATTQISAF